MNLDVIRALVLGTLPQEAYRALGTLSSNQSVNHGDKPPAAYATFIIDQDDIPPAKADTIERVGDKKAWRR